MADSYRSIGFVLINRFAERLGVAGYAFNNYANSLNFNLTNGAQAIGPSALWFSGSYQVPPGGGIWWTKQNSSRGIFSDQIGVFYVAQPQGGPFAVSISTNGRPWGRALVLNGYAPAPTGCFTNVKVDLNYYQLRIDGISGTNTILGPQLVNAHSNGIKIAFLDYQGIGLDQVTNVPLSVRVPIFQALSPDLLIWHMKEDGSDATRQRLIECERCWSNAIPDCSIVYVGTPYAAVDTNSNWTMAQNTVVRSIALGYHRTYMDCMTPSVSYPWLVAQGFMADTTHLNLSGSSYLAGFVWDDLGFFAARAPRTLTSQCSPLGVTLSYTVLTNILYTLEIDDDLPKWQPVRTNLGNNSVLTTTIPVTNQQRYFRLRLSPAPK